MRPRASIYDAEPLSLQRIKTYPLAKRRSKVNVADFAKPHRRGAGFDEFLDTLPHILAADDLRAVAAAMVKARAQKRPILLGIGGYVVEVGFGLRLIDLLRSGFLSGLAMNGVALVHDLESALVGN